MYKNFKKKRKNEAIINKSNKSLLLLSFLLLILVLAVIINAENIRSFISNDNAIIFKVNGYPIYKVEFEQRINNNKAKVFDYISKKYQVQDSKDFWSSSFGGEVPNQLVIKKAIDESVRIKIQQVLAKDNGIIKDVSYLTFLKNLKTENRRRSKAIKNREIIYGPQQYGEAEYFNQVFTNMIIKLEEKLFKKEYIKSDTVNIDKRYEEIIDALVKKAVLTEYDESYLQNVMKR